MKRSIEITILGWLYILEAGFTVIPAAYVIPRIDLLKEPGMSTQSLFAVMGVESILGILGLIGGIGILKLFQWARKFLITVALVNVIALLVTPVLAMAQIGGDFTLAHFNFGTYISALVGLRFTFLFFVITIFYLLSPRIKEQFR